ncbi:MAG: hypothetical protein P8R54_33170 [Myxococcota bacterium]|nr:hypothetical protein [Myxococcota bacterium]
MLLPRQFLIVRVLETPQRCVVLVAADQPEEQAMLWSGPPPEQNLPPHPGLARRQSCAEESGEIGWLELTTAGVLLSELTPPLHPIEAAELFAAIADAIAALHAAGMSHGGLTADRVHLDRLGHPTLLGAGLDSTEDPSADIGALHMLWQAWCLEGPLMTTVSAGDAAESLRVWLSVTESTAAVLPTLIAEQLHDRSGERLTLLPGLATGPVDEIGMDIGPDESAGGLLDPLTWSGVTGEPTSTVDRDDESTGALQEDTRSNAPRTALLSQLLDFSHEQPAADRFIEGVPAASLRTLIASETLDPLPNPDGLPGRPDSLIHSKDPDWEENTATAIRADAPPFQTAPTAPQHGEPTLEHTDSTPPEHTEHTTTIEVSSRVLIAAVLVAMVAGAAGLFFVLSQLQ